MRRPRILDLSLSVIALFSLVFTSLAWADSSDDIKKKLNQSLNGIEIFTPHRSPQSESRVVGPCDHVIFIAPFKNRQNRSKRLFDDNA